MVERHDLQRRPLDQVVSWALGDFQWHADYASISETLKLRSYGSADYLDDIDMSSRQIADLRERRVIA